MLIGWVVLLATSSAACVDQSDDPRDWPIATHQSDGGTMLALAESVKLTDDHGCVLMVKDGHQSLPIFPMPGTSWHDDKVTVHDVTFRLGETEVGDGVAAAKGDSGGPVITNVPSQVYARGLISGGYTTVSCGSGVAPGGVCYNTVFYVPISTILTKTGTSLHTTTS